MVKVLISLIKQTNEELISLTEEEKINLSRHVLITPINAMKDLCKVIEKIKLK